MPDSATTRSPRRRWRPFGWRTLALFVALLALFACADEWVKRRATGAGFSPESAQWVACASNVPAVWEALEGSEAMARVRKEWPRPSADFERALRQSTGIRPTPDRWDLWLGHRMLAAGAPEGCGACFYPGLLIRAAAGIHRVFARPIDESGLRQYGDYFYAWRDGFLIASASADYVRGALAAAPAQIAPPDDPLALDIETRGPAAASLRVRAEEGLPISGRIAMGAHKRSGPLTLVNAWPAPPIAAVAAPKWEDVCALLRLASEPFRAWPGWAYYLRTAEALSKEWGFADLPEGWDRAADHCGLALTDVELDGVTPVPRMALILRATRPARGAHHPLNALAERFLTFPCEWHGVAGLRAPLLGERFTLCLAREGLDWYATSQEPLMNDWLGHLASPETPGAAIADCDISARLDWRRFAAAAQKLVEESAAAGLLPKMDVDEARFVLVPIVRGLGRLGVLHVEGTVAEDSAVDFTGMLAEAPAEAGS